MPAFALRPSRRGIHAAAFSAPGARILDVVADAPGPLTILTRFGAWAAVASPSAFPSDPNAPPLTVALTLDREAPIECRLISSVGADFTVSGAGGAPASGAAFEPRSGADAGAMPWRTLERLEDLSIEACPFPRAFPSFFLALDRRSNPALIGRGPGGAGPASLIVDPIARGLVRRLLARAAGSTPESLDAPMLAYLSRMQRDLIVEGFGVGFSAPLLGAFSRFGSGELVIELRRDDARLKPHLSNGGPNGAFVFLFAEFALAALERGIDADFWPAALPALVAGAEHYLECYGVRAGGAAPLTPIPFADYRDRRLRDISPARRDRILELCTPLADPAAAAAHLARRAAEAFSR